MFKLVNLFMTGDGKYYTTMRAAKEAVKSRTRAMDRIIVVQKVLMFTDTDTHEKLYFKLSHIVDVDPVPDSK